LSAWSPARGFYCAGGRYFALERGATRLEDEALRRQPARNENRMIEKRRQDQLFITEGRGSCRQPRPPNCPMVFRLVNRWMFA
jgi:hypothetical protein